LVSDPRTTLSRLAGCADLMIAERLDKREFLIGELEILVRKQALSGAASPVGDLSVNYR
jgi:hypothetical protein